jgi:hypothetical protein
MINLPIFVNYRLPITNKVNFLAAAGANTSFYLTDKCELNYTETPIPQGGYLTFNSFALDFALKAGIEVKAKHRFQLNVSYFLPLLNNIGLEYHHPFTYAKSLHGGPHRLMFGVSVFL